MMRRAAERALPTPMYTWTPSCIHGEAILESETKWELDLGCILDGQFPSSRSHCFHVGVYDRGIRAHLLYALWS